MKSEKMTVRGNCGFTVVELLLYTVTIGIIILIISATLSLLMASRTKNQTIAEVEGQGAFVMNLITQTVRNATAINSPLVGAPSSTLNINVPTVPLDLDPTEFNISGGVIQIIQDVGGANTTTNSLTSSRVTASGLTFTNLTRSGTDGTIKIQFTLTYVNTSGRNEYDYAKTFYGSATIR